MSKSKSEVREEAERHLQALASLLSNTELTCLASIGEGATFSSIGILNSPQEISTVLASVILKTGQILLSNEGFELVHLTDLLTEATNMAFEVLNAEQKEPGKLIVGPWGRKVDR